MASELDKLRRTACVKALDKNETSLAVLTKYHDQLVKIQGKIPFSMKDCAVTFAWKDPFEKRGGLLGGSGYGWFDHQNIWRILVKERLQCVLETLSISASSGIAARWCHRSQQHKWKMTKALKKPSKTSIERLEYTTTSKTTLLVFLTKWVLLILVGTRTYCIFGRKRRQRTFFLRPWQRYLFICLRVPKNKFTRKQAGVGWKKMFWLSFVSKRIIFTRRLTAIHLKFPRFEQVWHLFGMNDTLKELVSYSSTKSKYFKARAQWHQAKAHQNDKLFGEMISRLRVAEGIVRDLSKVLTIQNYEEHGLN